MRFRLGLEIAALMLAPTAAIGQDGFVGLVTLDNRASAAADLYVDGDRVCSAPAHGACTTRIATGVHFATVSFADGDQMVVGAFDLAADVPLVLPITDLTF